MDNEDWFKKRGRITEHSLIEEIVDVDLMIKQMKFIFPIKELKEWEKIKVKRLKGRLYDT